MIQNAKIAGTSLGFDDHYSFWIYLDYGGVSQSFGGFALGGEFTDYVIRGVLTTVLEEGTWEDLKGKPCRVEIENDTIVAIGHYLKNQWFNPKEYKK